MTPLQKLMGQIPNLPEEGEEPQVLQTPTVSRAIVFSMPDEGEEPRISARQFAVLRLREERQGGFLAHVRMEQIESLRKTATEWDVELSAYYGREVR